MYRTTDNEQADTLAYSR